VTVRESVDSGVRRLVAAGFSPDEARRDAGVFSRAILGWSLTEWATGQDRQPPDSFGHRLGAMVSRRLQREPVAYITGVREFYGRSFNVTPDVLVPRPETEAIVETALQSISRPSVVIDVGTGSGCLAITMALEFPAARVFATDISRAAHEVAARN
jgi:release factor glutamine methyltransferase